MFIILLSYLKQVIPKLVSQFRDFPKKGFKVTTSFSVHTHMPCTRAVSDCAYSSHSGCPVLDN